MREEGTEIMGITNLKRFYAGYDMDKDEFVSIYYGGAYIGCICKPQRGRGEDCWTADISRILYKRRGMVDFHEDAYLAAAFAKNKKMEAFINKFYDDYEEYFEIYLERTPYQYHRIFINMDAATKARAMKALAIITAMKYSHSIGVKEFMACQMKKFYEKIYMRYYKKSLLDRKINIYQDLAAEYDLAGLSAQELGELYAVRIYISGIHHVWDDSPVTISLYLAVEDMAMLKPYGVLYPYKDACEAREGYWNKWIWPEWDDSRIHAWEEAWVLDKDKRLSKWSLSGRERLIEYVAGSGNKKKHS